jgi:hypothetical protein
MKITRVVKKFIGITPMQNKGPGLQDTTSQSYSGVISWGLQCSALNAPFLTAHILSEVPKYRHMALAIQ